MDEKLQIENVPFDAEPLRTNRYIVDLSEYEIPQWVVSNVYFGDDKNLILDIIEIVGGVYAKRLNINRSRSRKSQGNFRFCSASLYYRSVSQKFDALRSLRMTR